MPHCGTCPGRGGDAGTHGGLDPSPAKTRCLGAIGWQVFWLAWATARPSRPHGAVASLGVAVPGIGQAYSGGSAPASHRIPCSSPRGEPTVGSDYRCGRGRVNGGRDGQSQSREIRRNSRFIMRHPPVCSDIRNAAQSHWEVLAHRLGGSRGGRGGHGAKPLDNTPLWCIYEEMILPRP